MQTDIAQYLHILLECSLYPLPRISDCQCAQINVLSCQCWCVWPWGTVILSRPDSDVKDVRRWSITSYDVTQSSTSSPQTASRIPLSMPVRSKFWYMFNGKIFLIPQNSCSYTSLWVDALLYYTLHYCRHIKVREVMIVTDLKFWVLCLIWLNRLCCHPHSPRLVISTNLSQPIMASTVYLFVFTPRIIIQWMLTVPNNVILDNSMHQFHRMKRNVAFKLYLVSSRRNMWHIVAPCLQASKAVCFLTGLTDHFIFTTGIFWP